MGQNDIRGGDVYKRQGEGEAAHGRKEMAEYIAQDIQEIPEPFAVGVTIVHEQRLGEDLWNFSIGLTLKNTLYSWLLRGFFILMREHGVWPVSYTHLFLFRQFYMTFPISLYESAKIDGCSNMKFIFRILIPLTKAAIGAMAVYTFINAWNMYMWPLRCV